MDRSSRAIFILFAFFLVVVGISLWFSQGTDPILDDENGENGPATGTGGEPDRPGGPEVEVRPDLPEIQGLVVSGKVLDSGGRPIPGAIVSLFRGRRWRPSVRLSDDEGKERQRVADLFQYYRGDADALHPLGMDVSASATQEEPVREDVSGEDGTFSFRDAPSGRLRVAATLGRLSSGQVDVTGSAPIDLVLRAKTRLTGIVVDARTDEPLEDVSVRFFQGGRIRVTETDEAGAFVLDDLPPGEATVIATHPDYAGATEQPTLSPGEETVLRIPLGKGLRLVVAARGFHPDKPEERVFLPYTVIALIREADYAYVTATTGSDGRAVFEKLPPGRYLVNGRRRGYLAAGATEVSLPLEEEGEHEIFLDHAVPSTIRVVNDRGYPLPGATLWTGNNREEFEPGVSKMVGTANRLGEFEFPFDWDGKEAVLYARKPGHGMCAVVPVDPTEGAFLEAVLFPGCEFRGKVVSRDGTPLEGAEASVEVTPELPGQPSSMILLRANKDGKFAWSELPPGEVRVRVVVPGRPEARYAFYARGRGRAFVREFIMEDR